MKRVVLMVVLWAASALALGAEQKNAPSQPSGPAPLAVLAPGTGEKAYQLAAEAFADMWSKVTGQRPAVVKASTDVGPAPVTPLPAGDMVLIGSDAVQPAIRDMIRRRVLEALDIKYGSDDYRLLSVEDGGRRWLIVAGGSGRSTLYAVYDFFRRQAGVEYFWDGDRIPQAAHIDYSRVDVTEKPRFEYRGLRYFAHRGLHRFQAEHWDLADWQREIDWLVKKRFNLFMLRTGIDDLFQRAFPGKVTYPPEDGKDPDGVDRSYDDRTSFWPLKYRGELRKQVLQYARDRGLLHPEDVGTITHWYSHTPSSFYASHPDFPVITDQKRGYKLGTHAIWDIDKQAAWDAYWRLTETHIREFGGGTPRLFHTIGMAERTFGTDDRDNLQRKRYVYRKTQQRLRENYPDAPLLIASWDLIGWGWKNEDVQQLLTEFDPAKTILLDYTVDDPSRITFRDWNALGHFPWIFGIFHSYARNSDIHEDYALVAERLRMAAEDSKCVGMVMWTEISHSDTFLLEYLADNSWQPVRITADDAGKRFCQGRYAPQLAARMEPIWKSLLQVSQAVQWNHGAPRRYGLSEPQFHMIGTPLPLGATAEKLAEMQPEYTALIKGLPGGAAALAGLASLCEGCADNDLWRRDAIDMGRTVANRLLLALQMQAAHRAAAWQANQIDAASIRKLAALNQETLAALAGLLAFSDDYSMTATLKRLERAEPLGGITPRVNPHSELTLKGNGECGYCRSHHYELVRHVYPQESRAVWDVVLAQLDKGERKPWKRPAELSQQAKQIQDQFYATPLAQMAPPAAGSHAELAQALLRLQALVEQFLTQTGPGK